MRFQAEAKRYNDPEIMAAAYLSRYFENQEITYPINPFKMLKDEGVLFSLRDFKKLEGVYIPVSDDGDIPLVGININRPITRQRFTAAHELCHHFRDADREISCPIGGGNDDIEHFAEGFAAALLMPLEELKHQVVIRRKGNRKDISLDDVLEIADFFGVSFETCLYRVAYKVHAISGKTEHKALKKRISLYGPDKKRKARHMTNANLYAGLIDCYQEQLAFEPTDFAKYVFQHDYIFNDSRMEGLDITPEQAAAIVTDLRFNMQNSRYCTENASEEAYMSIAGHYEMYQDIFAVPVKETLSVYDCFPLNRKLFMHYPNPDSGGTARQANPLVIGAKFETIDYHNIFPELNMLDEVVRNYYSRRTEMPMSEYVKHVVRIHHRLTVIHPFHDGNGRTSRAFMNVQLVRAGMLPIYIKVEEKKDYLNALARADEFEDYDELYEIVFRLILRSYVELNRRQ